jgi:putative transposase
VARPLRLERAGARYHLTARGNERRAIFRDEEDRQHFIGLLAQLPERFGTRLHGYVLMPNHYHLLLETPEANLSRVGQWLNVSYSVWFNRRHQRSGHLFQGRYAAIIIEDDRNFQEVGRYLHLNPVRVARLNLDKRARAAARVGAGGEPTPELVKKRLKILREWKWSSYRTYVGLAPVPAWLMTGVLGEMCGGRTEAEQRRAFRRYVEDAVRQGLVESPWERLVTAEVLGTLEFARRLRREASVNEREQTGARKLRPNASWEQVIGAVERVKGEKWEEFRDRHGDWGRDLVFWLGRREGRLRLQQMGELAGGLDYTTVGSAISRFGARLKANKTLAAKLDKAKSYLSNAEM